MIEGVKYSNGDRTEILDYIKKRKSEGVFTVIDVGGSISGWSRDVVDAIVDIQSPQYDTSVKVFKANINLPYDWTEIDEYVRQHGKFDFSICSHTLEDISNPKYVCMKLSEISKEGFIAFPSKFQELSIYENWIHKNKAYRCRGCIHHRWIFTIEDNNLIGYPKMPMFEHYSKFDEIASRDIRISDLSFRWVNDITLNIMNNDYIGGDCFSFFDRILEYPAAHDLVVYNPDYISKPHW